MNVKVNPNGVSKILPYIGKETPTKVEKDFTVCLENSGMVGVLGSNPRVPTTRELIQISVLED